MALHGCTGIVNLDDRFLGFTGPTRETECIVYHLMAVFGARAFTDVNGSSVSALQLHRNPVLSAQLAAQSFPTQMDPAGLELKPDHMDQVIGEHRDEQMPLTRSVLW